MKRNSPKSPQQGTVAKKGMNIHRNSMRPARSSRSGSRRKIA